MQIPIYQVDAFTSQLFGGNPAAVCPLEDWLPDETMQAIAAENNLAETAFIVPRAGEFAIRWFTPAIEVSLCGHATLAAAHVVFEFIDPQRERVSFESQSGALHVTKRADVLELDFPAEVPVARPAAPALAAALAAEPVAVLHGRYPMAVFASEADVRAIEPDFQALSEFRWVLVTAPGDDVDFVSRFFAPGAGIPEDPVTGSAHCMLIPYWAERLGKTELSARQVSKRGGELTCALRGERVTIAGTARTFLEGHIRTE
jgi:PhzF family phenazine biosynthesis protein